MIEVTDALALLLDAIAPLPSIELPLAETLGRTLAETVVADRDSPPADRSAMDGFAVRAADCALDGSRLAVIGEVRAGQDPGGIVVGAGEAMRVFTGAMIPTGADAVVMLEVAAEDLHAKTVVVHQRPEAGQHIRRRGEDVRKGATVREFGVIVRSAEVAALAAVGRTRVGVVPPPRMAVVSTGDEIVEVVTAPGPHQVRNSNAAMLVALARSIGVGARDLGIAGDEDAALDAAIATGLDGDVLVLTGGVSVGAYDLVAPALARAGCEVLFHNVAMRPGKPILAAKRGRCLVFGLPGNPVSAFTGFHVFIAPALRTMMAHPRPIAETLRATLLAPLRRKPGRVTYQLATLDRADGKPVVAPVASASSGDVLSLVRANAFIVAPGDASAIPAGSDVEVLPWED